MGWTRGRLTYLNTGENVSGFYACFKGFCSCIKTYILVTKLRNILQNYWLVLFKSTKVMKDQEILRHCLWGYRGTTDSTSGFSTVHLQIIFVTPKWVGISPHQQASKQSVQWIPAWYPLKSFELCLVRDRFRSHRLKGSVPNIKHQLKVQASKLAANWVSHDQFLRFN